MRLNKTRMGCEQLWGSESEDVVGSVCGGVLAVKVL